MKWVQQLERKYGRYAIKNLMLYIIIANAVVFIFSLADPSGRLINALVLDPRLVLQGQLWRLLTFIAIPPNTSLIWIFFALYFSYLVGTNLEHEWGAFKFNIYYLCGIILTIIASFITGFPAEAYYINLSLFFAFAHIYPNFELMIYFVLPVKIKYLAILSAVILGFTIITNSLPFKIHALVPVFSYLLFFGTNIFKSIRLKRQVRENRKRFFTEVHKARRNNKNKDNE